VATDRVGTELLTVRCVCGYVTCIVAREGWRAAICGRVNVLGQAPPCAPKTTVSCKRSLLAHQANTRLLRRQHGALFLNAVDASGSRFHSDPVSAPWRGEAAGCTRSSTAAAATHAHSRRLADEGISMFNVHEMVSAQRSTDSETLTRYCGQRPLAYSGVPVTRRTTGTVHHQEL